MSSAIYNSRIIDYYVRLITSKYSYVNVSELLHYAGMKAYEVADQGHWFTQEQIDLFYEKLVQLTGNENIAREAGRYAASPAALGVMRQYALGLIGPANAFELINKATSNFTKSSNYESRKISSNKVEITVTPRIGIVEKPFQCKNRIGFFEALVVVFGFKLPHVQHPECIFNGGESCRYIVTWERSLSVYLSRMGIAVTIVFIVMTLLLALTGRWTALEILLPLFVSVVCILAIVVAKIEKSEMQASLDNTRESTEKLIEQIDNNYNNALMTNEIGQALSTCTNSEDILANVCQIMKKRLNYDRGLILIANPERSKLVLHNGYGYSHDQLGLLDSVSFNLDSPNSKGIFTISFHEQKPFLINDLKEIEETLSPQSQSFVKRVGTQAFICCPIVCEGKSIGLLAVDNVKTKNPLVQSDISLLMGIASVIGISLRNADLIESKVRQFNSVLQVLSASIDARDSLTAGHSEKVTEYSIGICRELNLSTDECEKIRVAALLHDYGKIGVPDAILKKEGSLTPEEYDTVKGHAGKTREILSRINFEGIYREVPEIAGAHHEKVDGSGYPQGLKGRDVPLGSKIIAVADYFEAVTAKRHYRAPMPLDEAFQLLRDECGKQFESRIVEAFLSYYSKAYQYVPSTRDESASFSARGGTRISTSVPVSFIVDGNSYDAVSRDLSMKGIFVASHEDVYEGTPIEICMTLPDNFQTIEARGRIAWVNRRQEIKKTTLPTGFGIELLEFKETAERFMEAFISRCAMENCGQG